MSLNDFTIDNGYSYNSYLNTAYRHFLLTIRGLSESEILRWENYSMIADELLSLELYNEFEELKYRLTDNENPNEVIIDILSKIEVSTLLSCLRHNVYQYIEEDKYSRFYT